MNFIANNNSWPHGETGKAIRAVYVTTLELKNTSITNNAMTGLAVFHTVIIVNGTSVFCNNTGIDGG